MTQLQDISMEATSALMGLIAVPDAERDRAWEDQVFAVLPSAMLLFAKDEDEALRQGPDGFYYLHMGLPPQDGLKENDIVKPGTVTQQLDYCLEAACGIAIFDNDLCTGEPFWLLTYGHLESLKAFGNLSGDPYDLAEIEKAGGTDNTGALVSEVLTEERQTRIGAPSESFLSPLARLTLKMIYEGNFGLTNVGVAILEDHAYVPSRHICFSVTAEDFESPDLAEAFMGITSWFIPPTRPLMFNPGLEPVDFVAL